MRVDSRRYIHNIADELERAYDRVSLNINVHKSKGKLFRRDHEANIDVEIGGEGRKVEGKCKYLKRWSVLMV